MCKHVGMRKYIVLTTLLLVAGMISFSPAQTWTIEQITDNTEVDIHPFITAVSSGLIVIYTHFDGDGEVFMADNFSGSWTTSRVTDNTRADTAFDVAANYNEQTAHISLKWQDTPDGEISYCSGTPGNWNMERVTDDALNDFGPTLAIDGAGHIHMAYFADDGVDLEVFYANNVTGSWISEQVTDNVTPDGYPWIALDSEENPHLIFTDGSNFWYTKKTAGIWTTPENAASALGPQSYPFLVLDADDNCHVTYSKSDGTDYEIYYANNATGSWQEAKVTSNDYDDLFPTLLVDPNGKVHIAYMAAEGTDPEIFYANNVGGVWTTGRVTDNSDPDISIRGRYFTADASGIGHIVFFNPSGGDPEIYHAYSNSPIFAGVEESPQDIAEATITVTSASFSSNQLINYTVPASGNVSLKIYDASGSLVKTLVNGTQSQGEHTINWDGTSNQGNKAAPGVYFCHLVADEAKVAAKLILK